MLFLLFQPRCHMLFPIHKLILVEPKSNFSKTILGAVTAMNDVPSDLDAEVTTDGARLSIQGVGHTDQLPG